FGALGCGRAVGTGDAAASPTTAPSAAATVTPVVADGPVHFGHRRLPRAITCPTGELRPLADDDPRVREAVQTFLEAALLPDPDPRTMWGLMDPSLRALFDSYGDFARQVLEAPFDPDYAKWEVAGYQFSDPEAETKGEPGLPSFFFQWLVSECDETTLEALGLPRAWAEVDLIWPRLVDEGLSIGATQLFFLGRPDGPKLWVVYH
ncbi:MAG TPA: hypothetical protein VGR13_00780, partial [Actinomycetota bacterium]|nr:hypothetical protein [Actinomycetota bacterium]